MTPKRLALPASSLRRVLIALVTFTLLALSLDAPGVWIILLIWFALLLWSDTYAEAGEIPPNYGW
jgi:hypothetical protein